MKLDNHLNNAKAKMEISVEKRQVKEKFLFAGELKVQLNQRAFKLDIEKWEVSECEYFVESDTINYLDVLYNTEAYTSRKILIEEGFDYVVKLNMRNALKYFKTKWNKPEIIESEDTQPQLQKTKQNKI